MVNFIFEKVDQIDSTNDSLAREVESGKLIKDKILISKSQTNGHGSKDRNFVSDANVGIYFSILHFYDNEKELSFITQKAAVAVYNTFKNIFNIVLSIKWVNDLYYKNKKICGILCKNIISKKAVIIGIGIDLFKNINIKNEIKDIAGYIFEDKKDLIKKLEANDKISKESCIYKNIYNDFKSLEIKDVYIDDNIIFEPDHIVIEIMQNLYSLIKIEGLPKLYVEKNVVKDERVYEDYNLEC